MRIKLRFERLNRSQKSTRGHIMSNTVNGVNGIARARFTYSSPAPHCFEFLGQSINQCICRARYLPTRVSRRWVGSRIGINLHRPILPDNFFTRGVLILGLFSQRSSSCFKQEKFLYRKRDTSVHVSTRCTDDHAGGVPVVSVLIWWPIISGLSNT